MKTLTKKFLSENRVLVQYIKDANGFRKGVVVAIGEDHIGWSLVSKEDYHSYKGAWQNIPAIRECMDLAQVNPEEAINEMFELPLFNRIRAGMKVRCPNFDKNLALHIAITRAMNYSGNIQELPMDTDLLDTVSVILSKTEHFFRDRSKDSAE